MKGSLANLDQMEQEERDSLIETRNKKMSFESKRHLDMKILEEKKIEMDRERLDMEKIPYVYDMKILSCRTIPNKVS